MNKRIIIVGGGPLGVDLARGLEGKANVTLIEKNSHYVHIPAMIRAVIDPSILDRAIIPYDNALKHGKVVHGRGVKVDGKGLELADGSRINGDYIVVATGSSYATPFKAKGKEGIDGLRAANKKVHESVLAAKTIAIVGAGAVGTELAGEIASAMPDKKIMLISNQKSLFPDLPEKFGRSLREKLKAMGVEVVLGQSAENLSSLDTPYAGTLTLSDGQRIDADLVFPVIGARANSELLATLPDVEIGRSNRAKVDAWLRPSSKLPNVFAAGDVSENGDLMTIVALAKQVRWLKKFFLNAINGKSIESMKPYVPWKKNPPIAVPLGPKKGNTYIFMTLGNWATSMMKGKDLVLSNRNKKMGRDLSI